MSPNDIISLRLFCLNSQTASNMLPKDCIEYELPRNEYIELLAESMFNPAELKLNEGDSIYTLYFLNDENVLSLAAGIYKRTNNNIFQTKLIAKNPNGTIKHSVNNQNTKNTNRVNLREWRA